jgi:heme/copper-type cytochrome/quinol oxidase subunit 4
MVKAVPVLGTLVLIGASAQVALGFQVAGGSESLVGPHILIGIIGLVLVVILTGIAFRAKTATVYSKAVMVVLTLVVLGQVAMGFQLLGGADMLATSHEANGFLVVGLSLLTGGITFWSAKKQAQVKA